MAIEECMPHLKGAAFRPIVGKQEYESRPRKLHFLICLENLEAQIFMGKSVHFFNVGEPLEKSLTYNRPNMQA